MRRGSMSMVGSERVWARDVNMDYDAKATTTTKLLRDLTKQIDKHRDRQRRNPTDARFVDDLDKLNESLNVLMRELG